MCHRLDNWSQQRTTEQERTRQPVQRMASDTTTEERKDATPAPADQVRDEELETG